MLALQPSASMELGVQGAPYLVSTGNVSFPNDSAGGLQGNLSDNSTGQTSGQQPWGLPFQIVMCTMLTIISFLSIFGNIMVITVVVRHRGMRTRTNLFLVNMAVADFLVGTLVVPFAIVTIIKGDWVFGDVFCTINGFLNCFCLVASLHTLMYISIHKYYSIVHVFSHTLKLRRIILMMCLAWLWATFSATITVWGLTHVLYKNGTSQCGPEYPNLRELKSIIHHAIIQVSDIFVPLGIMIFCYTKIFQEIRSHIKRMQENTTLARDAVVEQQKKVTMTLFIVLTCFVICWLPYHLYAMFVAFRKDKDGFANYLNPVAYLFGYLNSACNPIIYAWRSPSFREGYKEILCQTPQYVVADDTLRGEESQGPFRRLSSFLNLTHSLRRSQSLHNGGSEEVFRDGLPGSARLSSSGTASRQTAARGRQGKSLGQLMRAASKMGQGHCVIRRDGSFVVMKFGKVVSIKRDVDSPLNRRAGAAQARFLPSDQMFALGEGRGQGSGGSSPEVIAPVEGEGEGIPLMTNMAAASPLHEADETISCGSDEVFVEMMSTSDDNSEASESAEDPKPSTSSRRGKSKTRPKRTLSDRREKTGTTSSQSSQQSIPTKNGGVGAKSSHAPQISLPRANGVPGSVSSGGSESAVLNGEAGARPSSVLVSLPWAAGEGQVQIRISPVSDHQKPQTPMHKDRLTRSDWSLKLAEGASGADGKETLGSKGALGGSKGLRHSRSAVGLKRPENSFGLKLSRSSQGLAAPPGSQGVQQAASSRGLSGAGSSRGLQELAGSSRAVEEAGGSTPVPSRRKKLRMPSVERLDIPVVVRKSASTTNLNARSRSPSPLFRRNPGSWKSSKDSAENA